MLSSSNNMELDVDHKGLNSLLYSMLVNYIKNPQEIHDDQLNKMIMVVNTMSPFNKDELFLPWLFNKMLIEATLDELLVYCDQLYTRGLDFNVKVIFMGHYVSILTFASQFKYIDLVDYLIGKMKVPDDGPIHPIAVAVMKKQSDVENFLIENISRYSKYTPLTMATKYGYVKLFHSMLGRYKNEINQVDANGLTALAHAVISDNLNFIKKLIEAGADPLVRLSSRGETIFHLIFQSKSVDWVKQFELNYPQYQEYLYTPNSSMRDNYGFAPIHYALHQHQNDLVQYACEINPALVHVVDKKEFSLILHAIQLGNLSILVYLHNIHALSLDIKIHGELTLLEHCMRTDQVEIAMWLKEKNAMDFSSNREQLTAKLFSAIYYEKPRMMKWLLAQEEIEFNQVGEVGGKYYNLLSMLVEKKQYESIVEHDLCQKNAGLLFLKNKQGKLWFDDVLHFMSAEMSLPVDNQNQVLHFIRYLVSYLQANKNRPSVVQLYYLKSLVDYCFKHNLISAELGFKECIPLFHVWEFHCNHIKKFSLVNYNNSEEQVTKIQEDYYRDVQRFVTDYKPNLNQKNDRGQHLFAWILPMINGGSRIQWLAEHIPGFMLTDLDTNGSSLLHLACESQDLDMIRWCLEKQLSITKRRKDGLSAFDLAFQSQNVVICTYLIGRLNNTQWKKILNVLKGTEQWLLLESNEFYGRPPKAKQSSGTFKNETSTLLDEDQNIIEDNLEICLNYQWIIDVIGQGQLSIIKSLKQEKYQLSLQQLIGDQFLDVIAASNYKYPVIYQLLRFNGLKPLFNKYWFDLFKTVIERNDVRTLLLFLNQSIDPSNWDNFGLYLMYYAFQLKHYDMLLLLLQYDAIGKLAHLNDNKLLLDVTKEGLTRIVLQLLTLENVAQRANVFENDALRGAANADDLESCEALLSIPCVVESLKINDYELVKEAKENEFDDLIQLMRRNPDISNFLGKNYPVMCSEAAVHPEDGDDRDDISINLDINMNQEPETDALDQMAHYQMNRSIPNAYDFYDATLCGNPNTLEELFIHVGRLEPDFIYKLAMFTVVHGQLNVLQRLLHLTIPVFRSNVAFCNRLLCEAVITKKIPMVNLLLQYMPFRQGVAYYNNRLLRHMIRCGLIENAIDLLRDFSSVRRYSNGRDNYALRYAVAGGHIELVKELLKYR